MRKQGTKGGPAWYSICKQYVKEIQINWVTMITD